MTNSFSIVQRRIPGFVNILGHNWRNQMVIGVWNHGRGKENIEHWRLLDQSKFAGTSRAEIVEWTSGSNRHRFQWDELQWCLLKNVVSERKEINAVFYFSQRLCTLYILMYSLTHLWTMNKSCIFIAFQQNQWISRI